MLYRSAPYKAQFRMKQMDNLCFETDKIDDLAQM
jgi:hypothetical protein